MQIDKDDAKKKKHPWKIFFKAFGIFFGSILLFLFGIFIFFNLPGQTVRQDVLLGITFSHRQAEALGLDWKQVFISLLDDMIVREIRIPVYWDLVEQNQGTYDYSDVDWQLSEARKRGAHIILTVGQRVPRWPECHIPEWASSNDDLRKQKLVSFVQQTVERYKDHPEIEIWQVENEAFLPFFGVCPVLDVSVLDSEIAMVRSIDPTRPVLMSDSGELSTWISAASRGDIFGTTMYRDVYKPGFGYYRYPIGPNFFKFKEWIVRLLTGQKNFFVIELQGEPWGPGWIGSMPLEEQFKTMNENRLQDTLQYAQRVGFPRIYLWGAEWWYWLKDKQSYNAVWDEAKALFNKYGQRCKNCKQVSFGDSSVQARIADSVEKQEKGLSGTIALQESEGMLFIFPIAQTYGFWMKEMNYPIDIIWMNEQKHVVDIQQCLDPTSYPKVFVPSSPAQYVLEVQCGWTERNNIQKGDIGRW